MSDLTSADARILDRSLTHVGDREDRRGAVLALFQHTLRRMLGLRRPARSKVLPVAFVVIPYLPAIAFLGVAAILPGDFADDALPDPVDYYGLVLTAMVLFVALVGPQALVPDRRHRTLTLFLASRLTRPTYLLGTGGAMLAVLLAVTLGPPLLVQLGLALVGVSGGPAILVVLLRCVVGGLVLALLLTSLGLGIASLTDNRAFAAAGTFVTLLGLGIVGGGVFGEVLDWPAWTQMVDVLAVALEAVARIYGERLELADVGTGAIAAGALAWAGLPLLLVVRRYRTLAVAR